MLPLVIVTCILATVQSAPSLLYEKPDGNNDNEVDFGKLVPVRILTNNDPISSESLASYSSPHEDSLEPCEDDLVRRADGTCVTPILNKNLFVYTSPEIAPGPIIPAEIPDPSIDLNYVFLKVPNQIQESKSVVIPPPQQKTAVYVLQENQVLPSPEVIELPFENQEPEVYFVNYNEGENLDLPGDVDLQTALSSSITLGEVIDANEGAYSNSDESFPDIDLRTVSSTFDAEDTAGDSIGSDSFVVSDIVSLNDENTSLQFNENESKLEEESIDEENEDSDNEEDVGSIDEENVERNGEENEGSTDDEGDEDDDDTTTRSIVELTADEEFLGVSDDETDEENNAISFGTRLLDEGVEEDENTNDQELNIENEEQEETAKLEIINAERQDMIEFMRSLGVETSTNTPLTRLYSTGFSNYFLENSNDDSNNNDEINDEEKLGPTFENLNIYRSPVTIYTLPFNRLVSDLSSGSNEISDQRISIANEIVADDGSKEEEVSHQESILVNGNEESVISDSSIGIDQEDENDSDSPISFSSVFVGEATLIDEYQTTEEETEESSIQIIDGEDKEESSEENDQVLLRTYSKPTRVFEEAEILKGAPVFLSPVTTSIKSQFIKSNEVADESSEVTVLKGRPISFPATETANSVSNLRDSSSTIISKISPFSSSSINGAFQRRKPANKISRVPVSSSSLVRQVNSAKTVIPVRTSSTTNVQQLQTVRASAAPLIGRVQLNPSQQFFSQQRSNGIRTSGKSSTSRGQQKSILRTNSVGSFLATQRPRSKQIIHNVRFNPTLTSHGVVSSNNARRVTASVSRPKQTSLKLITPKASILNQSNRGKSSKSSTFLLDHIETRLNSGVLSSSRTLSPASGKSLASNLNSRSQFIPVIPRRRFNNRQFRVILKS